MKNEKKSVGSNKIKGSVLLNFRDLVRLITVLFFVPWFGWITSGVFGFELEFESEIAVLASFLIFGTFWCGWICPFGNLTYFINKIGRFLFPHLQIYLPDSVDKILRYAKYFFLAGFLFVIVTEKIDYFIDDHMVMYKSTIFTSVYISLKKYFILIVPLLWPRFFCKYVCFQKAAYNIINRMIPVTTIQREAEKCISCGKCDNRCPMNIEISKKTLISGGDCIGCYNCVDEGTCPAKANAVGLYFFGKKVSPFFFGICAMAAYYIFTCILMLM